VPVRVTPLVSVAAAPHRLHFAPDPSSALICTIGGNVAFNSGGAHCLKYGMTSNHVLGIKAVLGTGEVVEWGGPSRENIGPDWCGLFNGSEGLFGIALEITLQLLPRAECFHTVLAGYRTLEQAGDAVSAVVASGLLPGAIEITISMSSETSTTPKPGVAPGSIVSIFGVNLATLTAVAPDGMLPQTMGGLTVAVADRLLPLFFVSPGQINAQVPDDLATGDKVVTVSPTGAAQVQASFTVVRDAPGLFAVTVDGQAMAMVIHEDGSSVTADAPARPGELLTLYGTGFGPAERPRPEGFPIPQSPSYNLLDAVTVQVGQLAVTAENAFAVVGRCGIDAAQFRLDSSVTGTVTLRVTINGVDSNTLLLPVQ